MHSDWYTNNVGMAGRQCWRGQERCPCWCCTYKGRRGAVTRAGGSGVVSGDNLAGVRGPLALHQLLPQETVQRLAVARTQAYTSAPKQAGRQAGLAGRAGVTAEANSWAANK